VLFIKLNSSINKGIFCDADPACEGKFVVTSGSEGKPRHEV